MIKKCIQFIEDNFAVCISIALFLFIVFGVDIHVYDGDKHERVICYQPLYDTYDE